MLRANGTNRKICSLKIGQIKVRDLLIVLSFVLLLFCMISVEGAIEKLFHYSDEVIAVLGYLYILLNLKSSFIKHNKKIIIVWSVFLCCGFISTLFNLSVISLVSVFVDAFLTCNKFFVAYLASGIYFNKNSFNNKILFDVARIVIIILFAILLHDCIFTPWFSLGDMRYGISSQKMFFSHQTYLSHAAIILLLVQTLSLREYKRKYLIDIILSSIIAIAALRMKGIGFVLLYWFLLITYKLFGTKHRWFLIVFACIVLAVLSWNSIEEYFIAERFSPRKIMLRDSLKIMISYFPFGTGFGSFGSAMAAEHYSPLYTQLGYENLSGMGSVDYHYLSDSFWPCIFAQFGILGTIAFLYFVFLLVKRSLRILKSNRCFGFVMLMIVVFLLINSFAETSFFNPTSVLAFVIFGYCDAYDLKHSKRISNDSRLKVYENKRNRSSIQC